MGSYVLACAIMGQEFTVDGLIIAASIGAATSALVMVGGKILKTTKTAINKRREKHYDERLLKRISKHLPSDKNKNWSYETLDNDGNFVRSSKAQLQENPSQKTYIVNKDGVRIEIIDGYPQFSDVKPCIKVKIKDGIVLDRKKNYDLFDEDLADQWSKHPENIPDDFKTYFRNKKININELSIGDIRGARNGKTGLAYTWHESEDMHSGYLIKTKIHRSVSHSGGIENLKYMINNNTGQFEKLKMFKVLNKFRRIE